MQRRYPFEFDRLLNAQILSWVMFLDELKAFLSPHYDTEYTRFEGCQDQLIHHPLQLQIYDQPARSRAPVEKSRGDLWPDVFLVTSM